MSDIFPHVSQEILATGAIIASVVIGALRIQTAIVKEFEKHRKIMRDQFRTRDRAIRRLELWAFKLSPKDAETFHFQPGADPLEFNGSGKEN